MFILEQYRLAMRKNIHKIKGWPATSQELKWDILCHKDIPLDPALRDITRYQFISTFMNLHLERTSVALSRDAAMLLGDIGLCEHTYDKRSGTLEDCLPMLRVELLKYMVPRTFLWFERLVGTLGATVACEPKWDSFYDPEGKVGVRFYHKLRVMLEGYDKKTQILVAADESRGMKAITTKTFACYVLDKLMNHQRDMFGFSNSDTDVPTQIFLTIPDPNKPPNIANVNSGSGDISGLTSDTTVKSFLPRLVQTTTKTFGFPKLITTGLSTRCA